MFCCSAAGALLALMVVYKSLSGYFYDTWAAGAPEGTVFTANKAGWFGMKEYEVWFEKVFLVYLDKNIPKEEVKVLIADNLGAHISQRVMELCKENNIRYIFLPPNSTHLTQPLDVSVFAPMKKHWRAELDKYKAHCTTNNIRSGTIPKDRYSTGTRNNNKLGEILLIWNTANVPVPT